MKIMLPKYSASKFVNRQAEIALVLNRAQELAKRGVDKRVIIFQGDRGTGKSWLLSYLEEKVGKFSLVYKIDLNVYAQLDPALAVTGLLEQFHAFVSPSSGGCGATLVEMSRNLMVILQQQLSSKTLVLLVDHVYESDWGLIALLEDYLLGPLAIDLNVLVVMTGRGRPYPFKTPELRMQADFQDLQPFSEAHTAEQLDRHFDQRRRKAPPRVSEIYKMSDGNPLANILLATSKNPSKALDRVIEGMLEIVPSDFHHQVREYMEALCVLQSFDEERIPVMLAAYYKDNRYKNWSYAQARQVREALVKLYFAHWDEREGAYIMDAPTRKLLERYLKIAHPRDDRGTWQELHHAALELYDKWIADYPRTQEYWKREQEYHAEQLSHGSVECF